MSVKHFNYGWDHFWCDPCRIQNLAVLEFIKGPFEKPKLVNSIPFVTLCQLDGTPIELREGIPDCWTEYLTQKFRFFRTYLKNYELMHKEDVDVVSHLRKYRLYIGQGIPDPWTAHQYDSEIFTHLKDREHRRRWKNKKDDRCLCCEKEYLFECPDKCISNSNQCTCKDCHGKNPSTSDSTEKCRCSEILHNWMLENSRRKPRRGSSGDGHFSPNGSHSETEDEGGRIKERYKTIGICDCFRSYRGCSCNPVITCCDNSGLGAGDHERNEKMFKFSNRCLKQHSKNYFCPYIRNFYRRKSFENDKSFIQPKTSASKEIQTEKQTIKSKTVQTDKLQPKSQPKCNCHNKCFPCNVMCNRSWVKTNCPVHSVLNFCCSSAFTRVPAFVCPYCFPNHLSTQKCCKNESEDIKKRYNRKKKCMKEREGSVGSNTDSRRDQQEATRDADNPVPKSKIKENVQEYEPIEAQDSLKCSRNICSSSQAPSTAFEHLKYLAEYRLKGYLQQEELFPGISNNKFLQQNSNKGLNCTQVLRENSSLNNSREEGVSPERFKYFTYYKPKYFDSSFPEAKFNFRQTSISNTKRFNYSDQATMTPLRQTENMKSNVLKGFSVTDTDEPKVSSSVRNLEGMKALGKRRKLLRNRKRRRKLAASILGYQDLLRKSSKRTVNAKEVEVDGSEDYLCSTKVFNQNFPSPLDFGISRCADATLSSGFTFVKKKQEISKI